MRRSAPARGGAAEIDQAVDAAEKALQGSWGRLDAAERGGLLHRFSALIRENADSLAAAEALDVGKPLGQARADADLDAALPFRVTAAVQHARQTCSAGSRLLIEDSVYDQVTTRVAVAFRALRIGPAIDNPDVGPLINAAQRDRVTRYLAAAGDLPILAQTALPANLPEGGFYVPPTVIGEVPPDSPLAQEEVFGPVLVCIRVRNEADAVEIANGTRYGLVVGVWTRDGARQLRLARALRAGQVFINNYGAGGGVELPFCGVGGSGHGREKGFEALYGFSALKTVAIRHGEIE